jgi:WD40 repeat protein
VLAVALAAGNLRAQTPCPAPPLNPARPGNIFSEEQEMYLGDAVAEHVQREFHVMDDETLNGNLQRIGERLLAPLPPTKLRFRFLLVDLPTVNAFTLPGGQIYVTRKLVAFARTEDEVAGVLAHELGHALMRDPALMMSARLRKVLGVTQVGDRADVYAKYHQLMDNWRRKPEALQESEKEEHREQVTADLIAMHAVARAGYSPQAYIEFWDRVTEIEGKTGSWLSDLFGVTRPESKRLREMLKLLPQFPPRCVATSAAGRSTEFAAWKRAVVAATPVTRRENLPGILEKTQLDPPLRVDIQHLRFSPDGKHLLAQDDSVIYVLSRDPLEVLFEIDAPEARPAQFSPDSRSVVFHNSDLRVERWDIALQKRTDVHEVFLRKGCLQTALSPDGSTLACFTRQFDLNLIDVASGSVVLEERSYMPPAAANLGALFRILLAILEGQELEWFHMEFSPDGHYFLAGTPSGTPLAADMTTRTKVSLPGSVKNLLHSNFAFVGPDRLAGVNRDNAQKSAVVRFPSGELLWKIQLANHNVLAGAMHGDYLMLRPIEKYPVGVMDLRTQKLFMGNKKDAYDIYDNTYVNEAVDGEVALYEYIGGGSRKTDSVILPRSPLGRLRAAALSPDLSMLAVSQRSRGAVWDLESGDRVLHMRGFRGAGFDEESPIFLADFPEQGDTKRTIAYFDLEQRQFTGGRKIGEDVALRQEGSLTLVNEPKKDSGDLGRNVTFTVEESRSGRVLWSRRFPKENPDKYMGPEGETLVLVWAVSDSAAKDEINKDASLKARAAALKEKEGDYYLEVLEARTGKVRGQLLVETGKGSFRIDDVQASGDWVAITDTGHRVVVYSLASGEPRVRVSGETRALSSNPGWLLVETERGRLAVYKLPGSDVRQKLEFPGAVSLARFSEDGKRLLVLTSNQTVYVLDAEKW